MKIKRFKLATASSVLFLALSGCAKPTVAHKTQQTLPQSEPLETPSTAESVAARGSFYSAARPCIPQQDGTYLTTDIQTLLGKTEQALNAKSLDEILPKGTNGQILLPGSPQVSVFYLSLPDPAQDPVLVAQFGYGANVIDAFGIFWYEDNAWKSQPYPQASSEIAQQRNQVLSSGPFCSGLVTELHQDGNLLAVVNDLGRRGTRGAQEVQLLRQDGETWSVVWVPTYDRWQTLWNSRVEFTDGIDSFIVHREDINNPEHKWEETWQLQGTEYVKVRETP
jgi:hypothetical protein